MLVYSDGNGKRKQETFSTKREAERRWLEVSGELHRGSHVSLADSKTIAQAGEFWIERAISEGLERSTYEEYRRALRLHIVPRIGSVKLAKLTRAIVEEFRYQLLTDQLLGELSPNSSARDFSYFKIITKMADEKDLIPANVAEKVNLVMPKRYRHRPEFFKIDEVNSALAASTKLGPKCRAFAHLFWLHGLRFSEGRGLTWEGVNLEKGTVTVLQRADRWRSIGPPKSESSFRTIPLTPSCHLRSLHATKHTIASIWIEMGFSAKRVQKLMGHSSIQITFDLYGHLIDLKESAADMMR